MGILEIVRYYSKNERLAPWIKFIWRLHSREADFHYKLLPTDCIDVILNLGSEMLYETEYRQIVAPPFHVNGLRSKPCFIHQKNEACVFGISFYSYGLFPFVFQSITGLQDEIICLSELSFSLEQKFRCAVFGNSDEEIVKAIERILVNELFVSPSFFRKAQLIKCFLSGSHGISVENFCSAQAMNIKTFERMTHFYTGFTPKMLRDIKRFQIAGNQLSHQSQSSLTEIAYDNDFTDQTHFSKNFKRYSGTSPRAFQTDKITVKQNAAYTYR